MKKEINIFADLATADPAAMNQFYDAMKLDFAIQGAIMPDVHKGYALPIGSVVATKDVVVPAWVGYDIGCGMCALETKFDKDIIIKYNNMISDMIKEEIPSGFNHNTQPTSWNDSEIERTTTMDAIMQKHNGYNQLGTLGGGNHFIEIAADDNDKVWIVIHSGSRGVGHKCATHYMNKAATGMNKEYHYPLNVNEQDGKDYIMDQNYCTAFALENRKVMITRILKVLSNFQSVNIKNCTLINRNHNHVEFDKNLGLYIHRKGATHADIGVLGVIPGNMRDGSFIVEGLGNRKSLYSSSHGAGRVMSRSQAKKEITMEEFSDSMEGIYADVVPSNIDESPMAYKNIFEVMDMQYELIEVINHVKPIINIKAAPKKPKE